MDAWERGLPQGATKLPEDDETTMAARKSSGEELANQFNEFWTTALGEPSQAARALLEEAAARDHGPSLYYLATAHLSGDEQLGLSRSATAFRDNLLAAASTGNAEALFCLADLNQFGGAGSSAELGELFPVNKDSAYKNYVAAAELGHADAACCAGAIRFHGAVTTADFRTAFEHYQKAADTGHPDAWRNVATMHAAGLGVPKCEATARQIMKVLPKIEADYAAKNEDYLANAANVTHFPADEAAVHHFRS